MKTQTAEEHVVTELEQAESLFAKLARENRPATYLESLIVVRAGFQPEHISREVFRHSRILRLKAISGTIRDRENQVDEVERAAKSLETQGQKLQAAIDEAQRQLNSLVRDCRQSTKRLAEMRSAVTQLRECAPAWVREQCSFDRHTLGVTDGMVLGEMRTRAAELETLLGCKHEHEQEHSKNPNPRTQHCERLPLDHPCSLAGKSRSEIKLGDWLAAWDSYAAQLKTELDALRPVLAKAEADFARQADEIAAGLDTYVE